MRRIKTLLAALVVSLLSIVVVATTGTPAQAATYVYNYHGSDYSYINAVNDVDVWVCKVEADFHTIWAQVEMTRSPYTRYVYDTIPNNGCVHDNYAGTGYITRFRLCEETAGCSAWKPSVPGS